MVAQDGYGPVGPVVGQDLGWNVLVHWRARDSDQFPFLIIHDFTRLGQNLQVDWTVHKPRTSHSNLHAASSALCLTVPPLNAHVHI